MKTAFFLKQELMKQVDCPAKIFKEGDKIEIDQEVYYVSDVLFSVEDCVCQKLVVVDSVEYDRIWIARRAAAIEGVEYSG